MSQYNVAKIKSETNELKKRVQHIVDAHIHTRILLETRNKLIKKETRESQETNNKGRRSNV